MVWQLCGHPGGGRETFPEGPESMAADTREGRRANSQRRCARMSRARARGRHTEEEWQIMCHICGWRCVSCGVHADDLHGGVLTKDHINPIYWDLPECSDAIENIQPACRNCNSARVGGDERPANWRELFDAQLFGDVDV